MSAARTDIAKAGWLYRQSSVLHRWKRNWFVLYRDGLLRYFESQDSGRAEEVFVLRNVCSRIKTGPEVRSANPPEEVRSGKGGMFELEMRDGNHLLLCADTEDDMRAWQFSLDDARTTPVMGPSPAHPSPVPIGYTYQPVGYGGYPGQIISPSPGPQVIQTQQGTTTIITQPPQQMIFMDDDPYRYRAHGRHRYGRYRPSGNVYVATPRYW